MDKELFDRGIAKRKATLGDEYVNRTLNNADEFTQPFQQAMTEWAWGFGWGDETIDVKTRSMMNLAMIGALGKMHEWELHCRGALNNGVSKAGAAPAYAISLSSRRSSSSASLRLKARVSCC